MRSKKFEDAIDRCLYISDFLDEMSYTIELQTIAAKYFTLIADEIDINRLYEIEKELEKIITE